MIGKPLLLSMCVASILLLQATGLHLHVGTAEAGSLHGEHHHYVGDDAHDHEGDSDLSLFELGANWAKLLAIFVPLLLIFALAPTAGRAWESAAPSSPRIRRSRWRPLLRAPPLSI